MQGEKKEMSPATILLSVSLKRIELVYQFARGPVLVCRWVGVFPPFRSLNILPEGVSYVESEIRELIVATTHIWTEHTAIRTE